MKYRPNSTGHLEVLELTEALENIEAACSGSSLAMLELMEASEYV